MGRSLSNGKKKGLDAVSDQREVIAALAIDQRGALRELRGKVMGLAPAEKLVQYKKAVSRTLTQHASAIRLDAEYGLSAANERASGTRRLLAYEKPGCDKKARGRLPSLLVYWPAQRLVKAGADCVKLLLCYSSTSSEGINSQKHALAERVRAECVAESVPFFLEPVSYADELDDKSAVFARMTPDIVTQGIYEFSKPQYRVDVGVDLRGKHGEKVLQRWLHTTGAKNIENVKRRLEAAVSWQATMEEKGLARH